jgi:ribokinase
MSFDVIVCGSLHLDIMVKAPNLPRIDETAVGHAWEKICGGKGGNQAVQAARAGSSTALIGRVGNDDFGQTLTQHLIASGVDHSCVGVDPEVGSGMSVAILQDDGDYGAVIVSGANLKIEPATIASQMRKLGGAKVLVLQNEIPEVANLAAAKAAKAQGAIVVLNAAPARKMSTEFLGYVDVLIVNRVEAEAMSGLQVSTSKTALSALPQLQSPQRSVVITLGGEGLVVAAAGANATTIAAVPVKVTSTHGAGDCFVGTLAAQLATGVSLLEACHVANESAAAFVSSI